MSHGVGDFFHAIRTFRKERQASVALKQALRKKDGNGAVPDQTAKDMATTLGAATNTDGTAMNETDKNVLILEAEKLDARLVRTRCETAIHALTNEIERLRPKSNGSPGQDRITQDLKHAKQKYEELDAEVHLKPDLSRPLSAPPLPAPTMSENDHTYVTAKKEYTALKKADAQIAYAVQQLEDQKTKVEKALKNVSQNPLEERPVHDKAALQAANQAQDALDKHRENLPLFSQQCLAFNNPITLTAVDEVCDKNKGTPASTELKTFQTQLNALNTARAELASIAQMMTMPACVPVYKQQYDAAIRKAHACYTEINRTICAQVKSGLHTLYGKFVGSNKEEDLRTLTEQLRNEEITLTRLANDRKIVFAEQDRPADSTGKPLNIPILGEQLCGKGLPLDETAPCTLTRTKWIPDKDNPKYNEDQNDPNHWLGRFETTPVKDYLNNLTLTEIAAVVNEWNRTHGPEDQIRFKADDHTKKFEIKCHNGARADSVTEKLVEASKKKEAEAKAATGLSVKQAVEQPVEQPAPPAPGQTGP